MLPSKNEIAKIVGKPVDEVRVGFASTIGDLLHAGHIAYFREARKYCDYLICGIVDDPTIDRDWKNKPIQSLFERYIQIAACTYVDCVVPLSGEQDLRDALLLLKPDVRFVGEEYRKIRFTGDDIEGIEIVYLQRRHSFSSTDLRHRVFAAEKRTEEAKTPLQRKLEFVPAFSDGFATLEDAECRDVGKQDY